jgi:hypothetical protein
MPSLKRVLAVGLLASSFLLPGLVQAQTTPTVQTFTVSPASFNPNAYPNAYDVSYSLAYGSSASGVTVNADCHTGLTVQGMNDGGGLTSFTCGDIASGGANGTLAYGTQTLTLVFTNSSSQSISEAISLSAYGMNTVTKDVTIPPVAPTLSYISPTSAAAGATINVYGTNFNQSNNGTRIYIDADNGNDTPAYVVLPTIAQDGTSLSFVLPSTIAAGNHTIQVVVLDTTYPYTTAASLTVVGTPNITVTYPSSGMSLNNNGALIASIQWTSSNVGNYRIEIDLINTSGVLVRTLATNLQNNGSYAWSYDSTLPSGTYKVLVSTQSKEGVSDGAAGASGYFTLTTTANAPTVSYLSPTSAPVGSTVYVYGTNFDSATFVGLDGIYGTAIQPSAITVVSPTELSFVVPSSLSIGAHTLAAAEKAGSWPLSSWITLNVVETPQAPTASSNPRPTSQAPAPLTPAPTNGNSSSSMLALQQQLIQLITLLLQLLQQAAAKGLLTSGQLNSVLNTISH